MPFDRKDGYVKQREKEAPVIQDSSQYEPINIGTKVEPKFVNLGKCYSEEEKTKSIILLVEFKDVFVWCYDDLKNFGDGSFQHHILLKLGVNPFWKKLRNFNPKVVEAIFHEVDKILKAQIIYPLHHSTWIANIVPIQKKNDEIQIYVYFINLNQMSLKNNYPLPTMDHILQTISGLEMMSMLDDFSGYNKISVSEQDQHKIAFITPWGTFAYNRMPFELINVGVMF